MSDTYKDLGTCPHNTIYQEIDGILDADPLFTHEVRFINRGESVWGMYAIRHSHYPVQLQPTNGHRLVTTTKKQGLREILYELATSESNPPRSVRVIRGNDPNQVSGKEDWSVYSLDSFGFQS